MAKDKPLSKDEYRKSIQARKKNFPAQKMSKEEMKEKKSGMC